MGISRWLGLAIVVAATAWQVVLVYRAGGRVAESLGSTVSALLAGAGAAVLAHDEPFVVWIAAQLVTALVFLLAAVGLGRGLYRRFGKKGA